MLKIIITQEDWGGAYSVATEGFGGFADAYYSTAAELRKSLNEGLLDKLQKKENVRFREIELLNGVIEKEGMPESVKDAARQEMTRYLPAEAEEGQTETQPETT